MKRKHDDSADKMAELAGLSSLGNNREARGSVKDEEQELCACFNGSPGWNPIAGKRFIRQMFSQAAAEVTPRGTLTTGLLR